MLSVINSYFNDVRRTEDGFYLGYIDTAELYKQFLTDLKEAGFYFSVRDSETFNDYGQFQFKCHKSNVPVPFCGSPFRREKNIMYQCAFGSQYYGKPKKSDSSETDHDTLEKKRLRIRNSKKLGCTAKMAAKCIRIYPDYKISSDNAHWRLKKEVISTLKKDLTSEGCEVKSLSRYFVKISEAEQHCHGPMHPKSTSRKRTSAANRKITNLSEIIYDESEPENEINLLDETNTDLQDVSLQTIANVEVKEESANLREQCRKKNKEIMNLSYLCNNEDQLKELLVELTRVTDKLNENVSQSAEAICIESETPQVINEEVCLANDVSQAVIVDKDICLEIDAAKTVVVDKEICYEIEKEIFLGNEIQRAFVVKKESKRRFHKENEKPYVRMLQPNRTQKNISVNPVKVGEKQKKTLGTNLLESSSNVEILPGNGIGDNVILFIY